MKNRIIKGKAFVFGPNIDTDQIYPGRYLEITDPEDVARHAMEGADPELVREFTDGDVIVATTNFGCGSSREHAAITLKAIGVGAVIADSFARIFYRNAINLGLPLIVCKGFGNMVKKGDVVQIEFGSGVITNVTTGAIAQAEPLSDYTLNILSCGGIKPLIKQQMK
ncbi:MAG: 3-isopropylmalate dehydratase small subunit [Burkholderiaceae bacterium]|nr:3-isopropylmalate dehydratase small subunit [Burkholderiaceae bacterium]